MKARDFTGCAAFRQCKSFRAPRLPHAPPSRYISRRMTGLPSSQPRKIGLPLLIAGMFGATAGVGALAFYHVWKRVPLTEGGSAALAAADLIGFAAVLVLLLLVAWSARRLQRERLVGRDRAQWLATTLRSIGDGMIVADAAGRVTFVNETAQTITGWPEEEARGRPLAEIFQPLRRETREPVESAFDRAIREGRKVAAPDPRLIIARNGLEHLVTGNAAPIRDTAGTLTGAVLVFHDVTQSELGEAALRASQEMFRLISDHVSDLIAVLDLKGRRLYASRSYSRHFPGKDFYLSSAFDEVHPDDLPRIREQFAEMLRTRQPQRSEARLVRPDGSILYLESEGSVIANAGGQPDKILVTSRDITARLAAEESLRATMRRLAKQNTLLSEHARTPVLLGGNLEDSLAAIARLATETLGVARTSIWLYNPARTHLRCAHLFERDAARHSAGSALAAADYPAYFAALGEERSIAAGHAATDPRTREFAPGYLAPLGITSMLDAPIRAGGKMVGVVCHEHIGPARAWEADEENFAGSVADLVSLSLEVAQRREAEDALREAHASLEIKVADRTRDLAAANERLQELDRLKSEFLATMSHELRTPLNSIIGFTGILRHGLAGPLNDEQHKQLGMVLFSARHLLGLINDILDLSRIESGKMETVREDFKIAGVAAEVVQSLAPMAAQKKLALETDLDDPALVLHSDRKKCFHILLNLTSNAVKFTDAGRVLLAIRSTASGAEMSVTDTGIGIKSESMAHLFEAFRQVDGSARRTYEGTGLGLYLCKQLATMLGGSIAAESEFGKGSRFTVTLPRETRTPA